MMIYLMQMMRKKSASSQTFKKEPKISSFTKEDLKTYLMSKEHNEPHRLSNQKKFVYLAEIGD